MLTIPYSLLFALSRANHPICGSKWVKNRLCIVSACLVGLGWGCAKKPESVSAVVKTSPDVALVSSDTDPVRQFLADLEAQPADKRKSYIDSHQEQAARAAKSGDPKISEQFYSLLMPKMVLPSKP